MPPPSLAPPSRMLRGRLMLGPPSVLLLLLHTASAANSPHIPSVRLLDNELMPLAGIGMCCRESAKGEAAYQSVLEYLNLGGRHVDTARIYDNEPEVGRGINDWVRNQTASNPKLPDPAYWRSEVFLTTKVWSADFGFERTVRAVADSLAKLNQPYIDLVLLHVAGEGWAKPDDPECVTRNLDLLQEAPAEYEVVGAVARETQNRIGRGASDPARTREWARAIEDKQVDDTGTGKRSWELCRLGSWAALEYLKDRGLVRSIGVSNWDIPKIEALKKTARHPPTVQQLEWHPWYWQRSMRDYAQKTGMVLTAYGSMGSTQLSKQILEQAAGAGVSGFHAIREQGKTIGQVLLRWAVQRGVVVIPGTGNPKHMRENMHVFDFELGEEEMGFLDSIVESGQGMHIYEHKPELIL